MEAPIIAELAPRVVPRTASQIYVAVDRVDGDAGRLACQCEAGPCGAPSGTHLGGHQSLRPGSKAHQHVLPRPQLGQPEAAQRLHVDENIGRALAAREEAETAQPIEPLHLRPLEPAGRRHGNVGARRRHLRRMHRRRFVHGDDAEGLQAARALQHLDHHARAFIGDLEAVAAQARHVQENVGHPVIGNDETVALGDVEPFDDAGELDDARRLVADLAARAAVDSQTAARPLRSNSVRRHDAPTPPLSPGASCVRFESWPLRRYHSAAKGKGQNALTCQKRWMTVYIFQHWPSSVDDEGRQAPFRCLRARQGRQFRRIRSPPD